MDVKELLLRFAGRIIYDVETEEVLGRAVVFFWKGRLILLGYQGPPLRVDFVAEDLFSYRRRVVGFRKAMVPDEVNCVKSLVDHA
jgi:hypothetical protein